MIYIARFIDIVKAPEDKTPISVAKTCPLWYDGVRYQVMEPDNDNKEDYIAKLSGLNVIRTVNRILYLGQNHEPILVCDSAWQCEVLTDWLTDNGFESEYYKEKKDGSRSISEE